MLRLATAVIALLTFVPVARAQDSTAGTPLAPTASGWQVRQARDDMTNKRDVRAVVVARDSVEAPGGRRVLPRLVVACGDVYRGNGRKTLVVEADMAVDGRPNQLGMQLTDILVRFNTDEKPDTRRVQLTAPKTGVYLGDFNGFFFSKGTFKKLRTAQELRVRFMPLLATEPVTVTFPVTGLDAVLPQLLGCDWPT